MDLEQLLEKLGNTESSSETDEDMCSSEEVESAFNNCTLTNVKPITYKKNRVVQIASTLTKDTLAVASKNAIHICKMAQDELQIDQDLKIDDGCIDTKFSPVNNHLLYVACSKSNIKLYDLRTAEKVASQYNDTSAKDKKTKTFACFDVSPDDRLLAAGCEVFDSDAFIYFWDVRKANMLGGYWESHTEDVTQVKFNLCDRDQLLSASVDGLINLYDLREQKEYDAFIDCLNTEKSIEQLAWCKNKVYCGTHMGDVQFWRMQDATPYAEFKREHLSKALKVKHSIDTYIAGIFEDSGDIRLVVGSNKQCLRGFSVKSDQIIPMYNFKGNTQRASALEYLEQNNVLIIGGETGSVNVWRLDA